MQFLIERNLYQSSHWNKCYSNCAPLSSCSSSSPIANSSWTLSRSASSSRSVECRFYAPNTDQLILKGGWGRAQADETSLEIALNLRCRKAGFFWKFLDWRITWRLSSLSSSSSPENGILWRSNVLLQSLTSCLQVTCDLYFALVIYKLDSGKNPSWTLVKVLINLIPTIFYTCSTTLVITNRKLETWTCSNVYYTRLRLHFETLWS